MISEEKQWLRREMMCRISLLGDKRRAAESDALCQTLNSLSLWKEARTVAVFYPLESEPDIRPLLRGNGRRWCFPLWEKPLMSFHACGLDDLIPGPRNMPRPPAHAPEVDAEEIDLILVPGLAFDDSGGRMGRGGGYYDRYLADAKTPAIGLAFSVQKVDRVPREDFDVELDRILYGA